MLNQFKAPETELEEFLWHAAKNESDELKNMGGDERWEARLVAISRYRVEQRRRYGITDSRLCFDPIVYCHLIKPGDYAKGKYATVIVVASVKKAGREITLVDGRTLTYRGKRTYPDWYKWAPKGKRMTDLNTLDIDFADHLIKQC